MKKKGILLIIIILGLALVAFGAYKFLNGPNKSNNNSGNKDEPAEDLKHQYSGIYSLDDKNIYLFQNDDRLYFSNGKHKGNIEITNGQASYEYYIEEEKELYKFSLSSDTLTITSDGSLLVAGKYKKTSGLSLDEYFDHVAGDSKLFTSKYNGYYKNNDVIVYTYQIAEKIVCVVISSESFNMNAELNIMEDGSLKLDSSDVDMTVQYSGNTLTLKIPDNFIATSENKLNGSYKKEKTLTMYDIIDNDLFYDFQ